MRFCTMLNTVSGISRVGCSLGAERGNQHNKTTQKVQELFHMGKNRAWNINLCVKFAKPFILTDTQFFSLSDRVSRLGKR